MKTRTTLFAFVFLIMGWMASAQIEQVSVGADYTQQAYYNLATGDVHTIANTAWDIAFSNQGQIDGGIFINESASFSTPAPLVFLSTETDWTANITDLSPFVDTLALYNPEQDWVNGAFNAPRDTSSQFDYGWGGYNFMTHKIEGDRIFVIQLRDGSFIKFMVDELTSGTYNFRYANLDNSNEQTASISKGGDQPLLYFSFDTGQEMELDFDYDLVFQRYVTPLDAGDGLILQYSVTGVLSAPGTEAVVADGVDVETVDEADYRDDYSSLPTTIGHEWKAFDFTQGWVIDVDRAHFVKTKDGSIYKVVFLDFEGSQTGTTTLEKTFLGMSSSENQELTIANLITYPNPAVTEFTIETEAGENFDVVLFDMQGRKVLQVNSQSGQAIQLPAQVHPGRYIVHIILEDATVTTDLMIHR